MFKNRVHSVILALAGLFAVWELGVWLFKPPVFLLPPPSAILSELASDPEWYARHALFTIGTCLCGFALACLIGVLAAVGIVYVRFLEHTLFTLLVALNSIPKIALAPLFIIWMGAGSASQVTVALTIALFPIVIDTVLGLRSVDHDVLDLARSMRASTKDVLFKIRFPMAMPFIFSGMKVAISLALVGAIAGEFVASDRGLGYVILVAQGAFKTTRVFAAIILLGVIGTALFYIVDLVERWAIPWHVSHRTTETLTPVHSA